MSLNPSSIARSADSRRRFLQWAAAAALPWQVSLRPTPEAGVVAALRDAYESLDVAGVERLLDPGIHFSDPTFHLEFRGVSAMRPMMAEAARTIARIAIEVEHEMVCAPWVIARQRQRVSRRPPDGRTIDVRGVSLFRIAGDRIVEWHDYYDSLGYERQTRGGGSR
jgi:ketosteroid isomerase-like protein